MPRDLTRAITERVERCRAGNDPCLITRLPSGFVIYAKYQPDGIEGGCMLLPDPVAPALNDLAAPERAAFLLDFARVGDALLATTACERVNYLILCNSVPELHAHCIPRYANEDPKKRKLDPFEAYDFAAARTAEPEGRDRERIAALKAWFA